MARKNFLAFLQNNYQGSKECLLLARIAVINSARLVD